ncbi:hypothetical protein [Sodalis ligni]|uniref:hypothetical protein n=1 Tax=Sodalis ligni TaxID=2697027 RepID=UPI003B848D33
MCDRLLKDGHQLRIFERPRVPPYREFNNDESVHWVTGDFEALMTLMMPLKVWTVYCIWFQQRCQKLK